MTNATVNLNQSVTYNKQSFTLPEFAGHIVDTYKGLHQQAADTLETYRQIGEMLIQLDAVLGNDGHARKDAYAKLGLDVIEATDKSECRWIASNWKEVQKYLKSRKKTKRIPSPSAIRKGTKAMSKPKADAPKAEPKGDAEAPKGETTTAGNSTEGLTMPQPVANFDDFVAAVYDSIAQTDHDPRKVLTALWDAFELNVADLKKVS